jgi:hypothetical protein
MEQKIQVQSLKKQMGARYHEPICNIVPGILPAVDRPLTATEAIDVFGTMVQPAGIKDWSLDILTNRSFPKIYAQQINMRTGTLGSAKHVWEINRMLFLPRLAILYRSLGNDYYLNLIMQLVADWIQQNPYLIGINWYSNIEINVRLINWFLTWEILSAEDIMDTDSQFSDFVNSIWLPSIYQHCKYSYEHPSLHSSANNHLIAEYAGLFVAASKWQFKASKRWMQYAKAGLEKEMVQQHSVHGINKEEAAEYIQFITDFFLIAMVVGDNTQNGFSATYKQYFRSIIDYIHSFLTINGQFPKYGDEDDGRLFLLNETIHDNNFLSLLQFGALYFNEPRWVNAPVTPDQKNALLLGNKARDTAKACTHRSPNRESAFYPEEGHFIFRKQGREQQEIYCHFDAAQLGFLSIAAHGHADALSFMLHIDGQPFVVDPGTYCYHTDAEWRHYFVSTRAHNTVGIAGVDQATFIGPTLWLNHYKVTVEGWQLNGNKQYVMASHNGYDRHGIHHKRKLVFLKDEEKIIITDYIENRSGKANQLELPFHLHPGIEHHLVGTRALLHHQRARTAIIALPHQLQWHVVKGATSPCLGWYSERFYHKTPTAVIMGTIYTEASLELTTEIQIR